MITKDRIKANLEILRRYVLEEGKETGTVLGVVALSAIDALAKDFQDLDDFFDFNMEVEE